MSLNKLHVYKHCLYPLLLLLAISSSHCSPNRSDDDDFLQIPEDPFGDIDYYPAWSPISDWIAFRHGPQDKQGSGVYLIKEDGSNEMMLVPDGLYPNWSYDGAQLVLNILGRDQIFSVSIATGVITQLTSDQYKKNCPSWHPNSQQILYTISTPNSIAGIWIYDLISDTSSRLTEIMGNQPKWNPHGNAIVFYHYDGNTTYLSLLKSPSFQLENLLDIESISDGHIRYPSFSPDGTSIIFYTSETPDSEATIWIYDITNKRITKLLGGGNSPSWSLDGTQIVFVKHLIHVLNAEGNGHLWILSIKTGEVRQLTYE